MDKTKPQHNIQWNLDITNGQETGKMFSLYRGFVISRFFSIYRKIPKISPRAYILQRPLLRGLFLEGLILGGAYLRREAYISKSIGLAL